ncbi:hypothetical protein COOONC_07187 [Cooperia oncophora]
MCLGSVLRLVLVLSTFCLAVYALLDRSIIDRAELNAWIELQDEDQSTLKVVKADKVTYRTKLSYKKGEEYCEKEDAHLTSIRSQDEENFIAGYQNHLINVMQPEGITKTFASYVNVVPCDDLPVNNQLYVVCRQ